MSGYIKLYRGWREDPIFNDSGPFSEAEAWLWLIENATWKDTVRRTGQGGMATLERGQLHVSLGSLATAWKWSIKRVRGYLDRLEKGHMVGTAKGKAGTVLTITNYRKYQDQDGFEGTAKGTRKGTVRAQLGHTQEEGKEGKEEKNSSGADLPSWVPVDAWQSFLAMRKAIKKPVTPGAEKLAIAKLDELRKAGSSPRAVLEQSVLNSWQGLFEVKQAEQAVRIGI